MLLLLLLLARTNRHPRRSGAAAVEMRDVEKFLSRTYRTARDTAITVHRGVSVISCKDNFHNGYLATVDSSAGYIMNKL